MKIDSNNYQMYKQNPTEPIRQNLSGLGFVDRKPPTSNPNPTQPSGFTPNFGTVTPRPAPAGMMDGLGKPQFQPTGSFIPSLGGSGISPPTIARRASMGKVALLFGAVAALAYGATLFFSDGEDE
jgi:hypothetical protein